MKVLYKNVLIMGKSYFMCRLSRGSFGLGVVMAWGVVLRGVAVMV